MLTNHRPTVPFSSVAYRARAFPRGQAARPEDQKGEENEANLRKNKGNQRKMRKD